MPSWRGAIRRRGRRWPPTTSIVPFAAIAQGRNRFVPGEIGWLAPAIGLVTWAIVLWLHPWLFGVAPVAM